MKVEINNLGIAVSGRRIEGSARPAGKGAFVVEAANVDGDALIVLDSGVKESWEAAHGLLKQRSSEQSVSRVESDQMTYAGTATEGIVTIPGKTVVRSVVRGSRTTTENGAQSVRRFEQVLDVQSASASVTLDPNSGAGRTSLKKATLPGPVTFTLKRTERKEGATEAEVTTYTGSADLVAADFTGPTRTIVATGHVHVVMQGGRTPGEAFASKATITVDESMKPIKFELGGAL